VAHEASLLQHFEDGLARLRGATICPVEMKLEEDMLVVGSGMSFHNLRQSNQGGPASLAFHNWLDAALQGNCAERTRQLAQWSPAPDGRVHALTNTIRVASATI
jgi:aromatic ring-opening dioxygenase catalytic subunit (LigB family)